MHILYSVHLKLIYCKMREVLHRFSLILDWHAEYDIMIICLKKSNNNLYLIYLQGLLIPLAAAKAMRWPDIPRSHWSSKPCDL